MSLDNFEVIGTIGEGAFGKVTQVKRKSDGEMLVWKELNYGKMSEKEKQLLVSEVNILRELNNPHIVRYHDRIIAREQKKIYIVMEFCGGGDLATMIKKKQKEAKFFEEEFIWKVFAETAIALHECHRKQNGRVLHRDLKPGNVFFDSNNNVKLGDFGLARILAESSMFAQTHVGTPYYMSPEQVKESKYNEKSDIWSFGCLIYEMAALVPPFRAANQLALAVKIQQGKFAPLPEHYSKDLERALRCMIQVESEKRPTIEQILALPRIAMKYREVRLNMKIQLLKHSEEELKRREAAIEEKEKKLEERFAALHVAEKALKLREQALGSNTSPTSDIQSTISSSIPVIAPPPMTRGMSTNNVIAAAPAPTAQVLTGPSSQTAASIPLLQRRPSSAIPNTTAALASARAMISAAQPVNSLFTAQSSNKENSRQFEAPAPLFGDATKAAAFNMNNGLTAAH